MSELHGDYVSSMQGVRRYGVRQSQFKVCEWKTRGLRIKCYPKSIAKVMRRHSSRSNGAEEYLNWTDNVLFFRVYFLTAIVIHAGGAHPAVLLLIRQHHAWRSHRRRRRRHCSLRETSAMPPASTTTATPGMVLANLTIFRDGQSF